MRAYFASLTLMVCLACTLAGADVIDFESAGSNASSYSSLTTQGFTFATTGTGGELYLYNAATDCYSGCAYNGTFSLALNDESSPDSDSMKITSASNSLFSLDSIDVAGFFMSLPYGSLVITGYDSSNTAVYSQSVALGTPVNPNAFTTVGFSGWDGLSQVTLYLNPTTQNDPSFGSRLSQAFAIDNVVVNESAAVPEPSSLALLGAGLLGLFTPVRRKLSRHRKT